MNFRRELFVYFIVLIRKIMPIPVWTKQMFIHSLHTTTFAVRGRLRMRAKRRVRIFSSLSFCAVCDKDLTKVIQMFNKKFLNIYNAFIDDVLRCILVFSPTTFLKLIFYKLFAVCKSKINTQTVQKVKFENYSSQLITSY